MGRYWWLTYPWKALDLLTEKKSTTVLLSKKACARREPFLFCVTQRF